MGVTAGGRAPLMAAHQIDSKIKAEIHSSRLPCSYTAFTDGNRKDLLFDFSHSDS